MRTELRPDEPTPRQRQIFRWLFAQVEKYGYQPTLREMMDHFGMTSPNAITGHLDRLRTKGWLDARKGQRTMRGVRFLRKPDGTEFKGFRAL